MNFRIRKADRIYEKFVRNKICVRMRYKNVNLNVKEAAKRRIQINCDLEDFFWN